MNLDEALKYAKGLDDGRSAALHIGIGWPGKCLVTKEYVTCWDAGTSPLTSGRGLRIPWNEFPQYLETRQKTPNSVYV